MSDWCKGVSVKDWRTGKVSGRNFTASYCREDDIGDLLWTLHAVNFTEKQIMPGKGINEKYTEVSVEVISFLEIMNQNFFSFGDHYKL